MLKMNGYSCLGGLGVKCGTDAGDTSVTVGYDVVLKLDMVMEFDLPLLYDTFNPTTSHLSTQFVMTMTEL